MRVRYVIGLLAALAFGLGGCEGCARPGAPETEATTQVLPIGALDTLGEYDGSISVGGVVVDEDGRDLVLQDGSGLVRVRLREEAPGLDGLRLLVQGRLREDDEGIRLDADEWLFDSTLVAP